MHPDIRNDRRARPGLRYRGQSPAEIWSVPLSTETAPPSVAHAYDGLWHKPDRFAQAFWDGTRHHDVSQNYGAFLDAIEGASPYSILDLGCGPGRDLSYFQSLGHEAMGLDGSQQFVNMARSHSQCEVLHQDFLAMRLPEGRFDGIFANASLFHVPSQELPRVLLELCKSLKPRGVLFSSNPRGNNEEGFSDGRYVCFFDLDTWRDHVTSAGFVEVDHYYRPPGLPRHKQPWLATVWRKG